MILKHIPSGVIGVVEETAIDANGDQLVRIRDRWYDRDACRYPRRLILLQVACVLVLVGLALFAYASLVELDKQYAWEDRV